MLLTQMKTQTCRQKVLLHLRADITISQSADRLKALALTKVKGVSFALLLK